MEAVIGGIRPKAYPQIAALCTRLVKKKRLMQQRKHLLGMLFVLLHRLFATMKRLGMRGNLRQPRLLCRQAAVPQPPSSSSP